MKKITALILSLMFVLVLSACGKEPPETVRTIEGSWKTYCEMSDGTWQCDGYTYKYRLEISGRLPNAAVDSTYVYLSNKKSITFEQAWKAAGLSSNSDDYFAIEEAVLVEMGTE